MSDRLPVHRKDLSPTDISQYLRLERCERYLRLRMHQRSAGAQFVKDYDIALQAIPPLLTRSGSNFEQQVETDTRARFALVDFAEEARRERGKRLPDNDRVAHAAQSLAAGQVLICTQPRMEVTLGQWTLRGDVDLLRLERDEAGDLSILIADMKSSRSPKVEHRLQVAFYEEMVTTLLSAHQIPLSRIQTAILYRGLPADDGNDTEMMKQRDAAERLFGTCSGLLEIIEDADAYRMAVTDLVTDPNSLAERVASTTFDKLFFSLSYKCDGCLYNAFCMKDAFERQDLSLIPYLDARNKQALRKNRIDVVADLALLKEFPDPASPNGDLVPTPGKEQILQQLSATSVGPRLDELVLRARTVHRSSVPGTRSLSYIPHKGHSSLPGTNPNFNPNLIRLYIDAQHDYLHNRIYLIGTRVVACEQGEPVRQKNLVFLTDGPPDTPEKETALLQKWMRAVLATVVALAAPDASGERSAPIHLIFWNTFEQKLLLESLARNFPPLLDAAPALYDFITQLAAFDSPIASFLENEIREQKNYPMVCQSLHSVATYLGFDWSQPQNYRELFRERLFDHTVKAGDTFYTSRARYNSQIPLEFAYAVWNDLPAPPQQGADDYARYRGIIADQLCGFQGRRLEALEHIAGDFRGNFLAEKTPFKLPDLGAFAERADHLAQALDEFVIIERHADLSAWKTGRNLPPERRALTGETLLVRYCEADQEPGIAAQNRDNEQRRQLKEQFYTDYRANNPNAKQVRLSKEQKQQCDWSQDGLRIRLRIETYGIDADLDTLLGLCAFRDGDNLVVYPRITYDERLPLAQRTPNTPTPKQMLYGNRASLDCIQIKRDADGKVIDAFAEITLKSSPGRASRGFAFPAIERPLIPEALYTLDPDPNDWYGSWMARMTEGLCALESGVAAGSNILYDRMAHPTNSPPVDWPIEAQEAQRRFLAGLDALHANGALHDFEPGKRDYIGAHGSDPILLVQGPPGTGKSYSTAFAVLARMQGAMTIQRPFRVFLCCKTHAATDVLLHALRDVVEKLRQLRSAFPTLWNTYFDARLLELPLYRVASSSGATAQDGIIPVPKDGEQSSGEPRPVDRIRSESWCVAGITPGRIYGLIKDHWNPNDLFTHHFCDLLVLDEASQMSLPEALMAALPLSANAQLIVVGDPRQMPPIVKHDWENEPRRTFQQYRAYESLFQALLALNPPMIQFAESFRLHMVMAEFLRQEIYRHDGIHFHSNAKKLLPAHAEADSFLAAVLTPEYPLVVILHDEATSQKQNTYEQALIAPILRALADTSRYNLGAMEGLGVVVPHRAQRAALRQACPELVHLDPVTGAVLAEAVDTVERYQGEEREVILVSATESEPEYIQAAGEFLLNPQRLCVALSRAKKKMILVASRSIFTFFSTDEQLFLNSQIWKNLLRRTCTTPLWKGERDGQQVSVWGAACAERPLVDPATPAKE